MKVRELMTTEVVTIGPNAPLKEVAKLLVERGISGLPVCDDDGRVPGVVSEADILYKEHDPRENRPGGALGWLLEGTFDFEAYAKAQALTVRDAMTSPAVTIAPGASVAEAARTMATRRVNRLPVVKEGALVGIVTRADLVRAFTRSDAEIERELKEDLLGRTLWIDPGQVEVAVSGGSVELSGELRSRNDVELLARLAARVPGVIAVTSTLRWQVDDVSRRGRRALERTLR